MVSTSLNVLVTGKPLSVARRKVGFVVPPGVREDTLVGTRIELLLIVWVRPQFLFRKLPKLKISRLSCRVLRLPPILVKRSCNNFTSTWLRHGIRAPLR